MGERLAGQDEQETKTERRVKHSPEKAAHHLLRSLVAQGMELSTKRFSSPGEMREAREQFTEEISRLSEETGDISRVKIRATGSNLLASNIDLRHDDTGVSVEVDTTKPYVELGLLAEREGFYFGTPLMSGQDKDGYYFVVPQLILHETKIMPIETDNGAPIAVVAIQEFTKVPIGGDTYLDVPKLEAHKARKRAFKEVDYKNLASGEEIMDALYYLKDAFKLTNEHVYMKLEDMEQLYRLGRVTREEADVETITTAMRELFGRERRVVVNSMAYRGVETGQLEPFAGPGKVVDILSSHEKLRLRGLTLVIEGDETEEDDPGLYYVPLDYIESLEF